MFSLRYVAILEHPIKHGVSTRQAVFRIVDRVVVRRRLRDSDKRSGLGESQIRRILREIALRCSLNAIGAGTVVHGVEIHKQDFVLAVVLLDFNRQVDLSDLALERYIVHFVSKNRVSNELLRDGGCTLAAGTGQRNDRGTTNADDVEAAVLVEALVLGGNRSLKHVRADLVKLDRIAILYLEASELGLFVRSENGRRHRGVQLRNVRDVVILEIADPLVTKG